MENDKLENAYRTLFPKIEFAIIQRAKFKYIKELHRPIIRLLLPVIIDADNSKVEAKETRIPKYRPTSSSQLKEAIYEEYFYKFLVLLLKSNGDCCKKTLLDASFFSDLKHEKLNINAKRILFYRCNYTFLEYFLSSLRQLSFPRKQTIPKVIFDDINIYTPPEEGRNKVEKYANIIISLLPVNLTSLLDQNIDILSGYAEHLNEVHSTSAFFNNDIFKILCYLVSQRNGKIWFGQHGGGFNVLKSLNSRDMIYDLATDVKFWSCQFSNNKTREKNKINIRLPKIKPYFGQRPKITFIEYNWPDYRVDLASIPQSNQVKQMRKQNSIFLRGSLHEVVMCLYPDKSANKRKEEYKKSMNEGSCFKSEGESTRDCLNSSSLMVTNIPNTVFYQCVLYDYPVVLWEAPGVKFDASFAQVRSLLIKAGIIHLDVESATYFVNEVCVEEWWNSKPVRIAVKEVRAFLLGIR